MHSPKIYSLNGYEYYQRESYKRIVLGGMGFNNYCINKGSGGLLVQLNSLSNKTTCDRLSNSARCIIAYIYTGNKNSRAVIGKNLFLVSIFGDGVERFSNNVCEANVQDSSNTSENLPNGSGCLKRIMQNNWKIDY